MDMNALMRQAQAMQRQMMKAQRELEAKLFELDSSGGAIHISIYGSKKLESITIDKDAIEFIINNSNNDLRYVYNLIEVCYYATNDKHLKQLASELNKGVD